ncbi:MAG TPA: hypothetical protein VFY71_18280 [Planctomycetota bacterium]|nr:hypothetical protein [Planctomycetota bacterium]
MVVGALAGAPAKAARSAPAPAESDEGTLLLDGLLNSGFELLADGNAKPPSYGAYWMGACAGTKTDPEAVVAAGDAFRGERFLHLPAGSEVLQKIVAAPGHTSHLRVSLAMRGVAAQLGLVLEDGSGQSAGVRLVNDGTILRPIARAEGALLTSEDVTALAPRQAQGSAARAAGDAAEWRRASFDLGALLASRLHKAPQPRLVLRLSAIGPLGASMDVDEVIAEVRWPQPTEAELTEYASGLVRETLSRWFETPEHGGLGLVDALSGYVTHGRYDLETGARGPDETVGGLHAIHSLLVDWLREARRRGWQADVQRWTPVLQRCVRTLLQHGFDPDTGLPRLVSLPDETPLDDTAVALAPWVEFLLDAREQVVDEALAAQGLAQARRIADTLLALQQQHDLSPAEAPAGTWDEARGRIVGNDGNWFGCIPDRLTPKGTIETDGRFDTSGAILTGHTSGHGLLRSARAIARVHALAPHPEDVPGLNRALAAYRRDWDVSRYEPARDDGRHYGHLVGDALDIALHAGAETPDALALVRSATDVRLARDAARIDDTRWIQAVRQGVACPADSSRAFLGLLQLDGLKPELSSPMSSPSLYHDALLELARNDLQGRQLANTRFTGSGFRLWDSDQDDGREHEAGWWDAGEDGGAGPPTSAIDAQQAALRGARAGERLPLLAALALIRDVTDAGLRRPYGWLDGVHETAREDQLPDDSGAGLAYVAAWMRLLPCLSTDPEEPLPALEIVDGGAALRLSGPPGATIVLAQAEELFATRPSEGDSRLLPIDDVGGTAGTWPPRVPLDAAGTAKVGRRGPPGAQGWVAPLVRGPAGEVVQAGAAVHY